MEHLHDSLGAPLAHRVAAMARLTDREMDDIIKEAVRHYLDEQEKTQTPGVGFKEVLRACVVRFTSSAFKKCPHRLMARSRISPFARVY